MKNNKLKLFLIVTALLSLVFAFSAFAANVGDVVLDYDDSTENEDDQIGYDYKLTVNAVDEAGEASTYTLEITGDYASVYSPVKKKYTDEETGKTTETHALRVDGYSEKISYVKIGGSITTIDGSAFAHYYHKLTTLELSPKVKTIGGIAFENCGALKTIFVTGNDMVEGTFDLSYITKYSGGFIFDGCRYVEHIILSTEGSYNIPIEFLKANQKLTEIHIPSNVTSISPAAFSGCTALKNVYIEGNTNFIVKQSDKGKYPFVVNPTNANPDGTPQNVTISAPRNSSAQIYAEEFGLSYIQPVTKDLMCDGSLLTTLDIVNGFDIRSFYENDNKIYLVFADADCTVLAGDIAPEDAGSTLYAKALINFLGYMVRVKDYHGLRAVYRFDATLFDSLNDSTNNNYEITEVGVLGEQYLGARPTLDLDRANASKTVIYSGKTLVGSLLHAPENNDGKATFAYTATGFENGGSSVTKTYAAQEIMFCAYAKIKNTASGEEQIIYSDITTKNLSEACDATLSSSDVDKLTDTEKEFVANISNLNASKTATLSKEQILAAFTSTYSGSNKDKILISQHVGGGTNSIHETLEATYEHTGGHYPAMLEIDIGEILYYGYRVESTENGETGTITPNGYNGPIDVKGYTIECLFDASDGAYEGNIINDLVRYSQHGGIVGISAHYYNPLPIQTINQGIARGRIGADMWDTLLQSYDPETNTNDASKRTSDIEKNFFAQLEYTYKIMKALEDAGVSVVWRPYHETNGAWFWFCGATMYEEFGKDMTKAVEYYNRLYNMTYNYFTVEKGLTNLIWAISPNIANDSSACHTGAFIPSSGNFQIAGLDWYMGGSTPNNPDNNLINNSKDNKKVYSKLSETNKIVALTEWGTSGGLLGKTPEASYGADQALQLLKDMYNQKDYSFSYITFWSSWEGAFLSTYAMNNMDVFMDDPITLGLKESKDLFYNNYLK